MKCNVGGLYRNLRIIVGLVVLALGALEWPRYNYWYLLGLIPLLTGYFSFCPAYAPFKISTAKKVAKKSAKKTAKKKGKK